MTDYTQPPYRVGGILDLYRDDAVSVDAQHITVRLERKFEYLRQLRFVEREPAASAAKESLARESARAGQGRRQR